METPRRELFQCTHGSSLHMNSAMSQRPSLVPHTQKTPSPEAVASSQDVWWLISALPNEESYKNTSPRAIAAAVFIGFVLGLYAVLWKCMVSPPQRKKRRVRVRDKRSQVC
ncbi:uncharacterized protein isoform X1 [Salmo salar]|uniref:Uncharacterized protein isoform X1 n=1 Tax=Salmo salar TaxID=8030 RepID=A0ABM3DKC8_SALSA|nr:uncharacterized protein sb:cb288 isoform X1 [Salmo salar]